MSVPQINEAQEQVDEEYKKRLVETIRRETEKRIHELYSRADLLTPEEWEELRLLRSRLEQAQRGESIKQE